MAAPIRENLSLQLANSLNSALQTSAYLDPRAAVPGNVMQPMISIQNLRNIDPEMDRARDEALKTAEADRARLRREQRQKWTYGDVLAFPELKDSSALRSLRSSRAFCAITGLKVNFDEGDSGSDAAAPPSRKPAGSQPASQGADAPLYQFKKSMAVLLELEIDARKWYGAAAAPYFEDLGHALERRLGLLRHSTGPHNPCARRCAHGGALIVRSGRPGRLVNRPCGPCTTHAALA
jgi:hypothetical protein